MLKKFFGKSNKTEARVLSHPSQLAVGDMLTLKPRSELPEELQDATLTVRKIHAYQYSDGISPEYVLDSIDGKIYTFSMDDSENGDYFTISKKLSSQEVERFFIGDEIAELWGEDFPVLKVNNTSAGESGWLASEYRQTIKEATAYFYDSDRRQEGVSHYEDDAEELRYHECEGKEDRFSLTIEIWEDGSTEFFSQVNLPLGVIDEMWPNGWANYDQPQMAKAKTKTR